MDDRYGVEMPGTLFERARSGALLGAGMATFGALYVLGLYLVRGEAPFERHGATVGATVLGYYGAGILAGGCLGVLWPLRRSRDGAAVLGGIGGFLAYSAVSVMRAGIPLAWREIEWTPPLVMAGIWAVLSATVMYRPPRPQAPPPAPSRLRTLRPPSGDHDA